ncbi:hypothetical protein GGI15_003692 [Coemansia interrupta]|uniref:Uncharacterized protein n=1 Tax=Coemansia interrupta TaxID=1126814 RepID=A0A9W8LHA9_9FUNG|nr:hypothetical protein GGI15_003692 [Coemansia interrupta]
MWETHVIYDSDDVDNGNIGRETAQMWDEYNWGDGLMAAKEEWGHNQAEYSSNSNVYYVPEVDEHGNVVFREMLRGTHEDIELRRMPDLH